MFISLKWDDDSSKRTTELYIECMEIFEKSWYKTNRVRYMEKWNHYLIEFYKVPEEIKKWDKKDKVDKKDKNK